jgi:Ca2+-binding RTX toxin-like protein
LGNVGNDQRIRGNLGNDQIEGRGGDDLLQGEGGVDTVIYSGNRADYLITDLENGSITIQDQRAGPNDGTDTVQTMEFFQFADGTLTLEQLFQNVIAGTESNDILIGTANADSINGLGGNDQIKGNAGNDTIDGGSGTDRMEGGTGDDVYVVDRSTDDVIEKAGEGHDHVQASANFDLGANVEDLTLLGIGNFKGTGNGLANVIIGNDGTNVLNGNGGDDTLSGQAGSDTLDGGGGNDSLSGGEGSDTLKGGADNDMLTGEAGNDTLNGDGGDDRLHGGQDHDTLDGGAGNDALYGDAGNDSLQGSGGADILIGGTGDDTLNGGVGDDKFVFNPGDGNDSISGFVAGVGSVDVIDVSAYGFADFNELMGYATMSAGNTVFHADGSSDSLTLQNVSMAALSSSDFII